MNLRWVIYCCRPVTILMVLSLLSCGESNEGEGSGGMQQLSNGQSRSGQTFESTQTSAQTSAQGIESLKSRLFDEPDNIELLSALGDAYFESAQYVEAIKIYDKAITLDPNNADCMNDRGLAYFYTDNIDAALASIDQAIEVAPSYMYSWLSKGYMLFTLGRYEEAIEPLNKVKELDLFGNLAKEADKYLVQIEAARMQN